MTMTANKQQATGKFEVLNARGLHTRPSTELVKRAIMFKSHISLSYQKNTINAKSILGILMLAAPKGAKITVEAYGEDAEEAVAAILDIAEKQFHTEF